MTIDFHTHCFPAGLAPRAIAKLADSSGGLKPYTDGTPEGLLKRMDQDGVERACVLNIATNAHQQKKVNDFAFSLKENERLIPFGSVFPHAPDALEELERIRDMGLVGVKFHPDYQGFFVDDEKMKPIYRKISQLGLITVFHAGKDYGYRPPFHCMPNAMAKALRWFDSPVVSAHWGGVGCGEEVLERLCGLPLFLDTSFGYSTQPKAFFERILEKHGTDRLLFGSDSPWHRPCQERRLLDSLKLSLEEQEKIYHKNAEKLLNIL